SSGARTRGIEKGNGQAHISCRLVDLWDPLLTRESAVFLSACRKKPNRHLYPGLLYEDSASSRKERASRGTPRAEGRNLLAGKGRTCARERSPKGEVVRLGPRWTSLPWEQRVQPWSHRSGT
ncbi:unnamed protein product, partial [Ectocarpus sp. 4 AP-2014]